MVRKIKFPLIMKDNVEVRTIENLIIYFDLEKVIEYFLNGKLKTWLEQRNYIDQIALIEELEKCEDKKQIPNKLCEIFDVEYKDEIDISEIQNINEREILLMQFTADQDWKHKIDYIAFTQEELESNLLNWNFDKAASGKETYICGTDFVITDEQKDITYIGVNQCTVKLQKNEEFDCKVNKINFKNLKLTSNEKIKVCFLDNENCIIDDNKISILNQDKLEIEKSENINKKKEEIKTELINLVDNYFENISKLTSDEITNFSKESEEGYASKRFSDSELPYYGKSWHSYPNEKVDYFNNEATKDIKKLEKYYKVFFERMIDVSRENAINEVNFKYDKYKSEYDNIVQKINEDITYILKKYNLENKKEYHVSNNFHFYKSDFNQDVKDYVDEDTSYGMLFTETDMESSYSIFGNPKTIVKIRISPDNISSYKERAISMAGYIGKSSVGFVLRQINVDIPKKIKDILKKQIEEIYNDL